MRVLVLFAACAVAAAQSSPQIKVVNGKLLSVVGGAEYDHGDMGSKTVQEKLEKAGEEAAAKVRRNGENVADLMKEIILSNKAVATAVDDMSSDMVTALKDFAAQVNASGSSNSGGTTNIILGQDGGGSSTKASGFPWNPVANKPLGDSGGEMFRVTFPQGMELMSEKTVDIYQCKFTLLDSKGEPTKDARWTTKASADTPRTFKCVTPQWNQPGQLPKAQEWKTLLSVWENDREMPAPKNPTVHKWVPTTPRTDLPEKMALAGSRNGATFTVDFNLVYPYGPAGYEEIEFAFKPSSSELGLAKVTAKDSKQPARTLQFFIKTSQKEATYKLLVTAASKSTKMRSVHTIVITYKGERGIEQSAPASSCMEAKNQGATKNGLYWIRMGSKVYQAYCNQVDNGGGWHLLMKNKAAKTFFGKSNYWTTGNTLNPTNKDDLMNVDAKYPAFNEMPIKELFVQSPTAQAVLKCEMSQLQNKPQTLLWQMQKTTQELTWVSGEKYAANLYGTKNRFKNWCGRGGRNKNKAWRLNGWNRGRNFIVRLGSQVAYHWDCSYGNDPRGVSTGASSAGFGIYDRNWGGYSHADKSSGIRQAHDYSGQWISAGRIWGR